MKASHLVSIVVITCVSCSPYKAVYQSRTDTTLTILNDTMMHISSRNAGGSWPYRQTGNILTAIGSDIEPAPPYGLDPFTTEIFEVHQDSLVVPRNGLVFYEKSYYNRHKLGDTFYFIQKGLKYKVTPDNPHRKAYFKSLCDTYYHHILPPEKALALYHINPNFDCWIISDEIEVKHDPHDLD